MERLEMPIWHFKFTWEGITKCDTRLGENSGGHSDTASMSKVRADQINPAPHQLRAPPSAVNAVRADVHRHDHIAFNVEDSSQICFDFSRVDRAPIAGGAYESCAIADDYRTDPP